MVYIVNEHIHLMIKQISGILFVRFLNMVQLLNYFSIFLQAFRIPLGAVGYYIVAKFTPMTSDGESGEPAYVISERAVEST